MAEANGWRHMTTAPRDGTRILVTIRASEQGPAEVDVAYWARADRNGDEGWRAFDSEPGQVVGYPETELKCWMPMPSAEAGEPSTPVPWEGDEMELHGSGI